MCQRYLWLEADLSAVDRTVTPFVLMQSHCPFYSTNKNHFQEWQALDMQETFEPLMLKYGVDLMLSGHGKRLETTAIDVSKNHDCQNVCGMKERDRGGGAKG